MDVLQQVVVLLERCPVRLNKRMAKVRKASSSMLHWLGEPFARLRQRVDELGSSNYE
jgi:hypothetical protein